MTYNNLVKYIFPNSDHFMIVIHSFNEVMNMAELILFERANFAGRQRRITQSQSSLGDFDRITSSIDVHDGHWQLFTDTNYRGRIVSLGHGSYPWVEAVGITNDAVRSVKLVP
jgi:hypothetical protein